MHSSTNKDDDEDSLFELLCFGALVFGLLGLALFVMAGSFITLDWLKDNYGPVYAIGGLGVISFFLAVSGATGLKLYERFA